ncbi:MAG: IS30 family transposase [Candidatus Thiodiazotropha sp. (ex Lucinoma aequizonata)]|nr:IS30 family transposase [Candidatus Thiodiazotropha sp. (ex Lucinoma aequizonata)]MCU7887209.1 IS30 family transposase [Candidatus Thiodiazotropha sp. (ex Lucinoma aequizonata)]MCU7911476.1 IS30 family transposase [Candidatus Thiodiazotropha sp. (ex Lucinoma aequizonata)]
MPSKPYRKRYAHYDRRGKIKNRVDIDERPAIMESRCRIGDWEGDTVMGKGLKSALLTMVERKTLYTVIMRLTGKQSSLLAEAAVTGLKALKSNILTSPWITGWSLLITISFLKGSMRNMSMKMRHSLVEFTL